MEFFLYTIFVKVEMRLSLNHPPYPDRLAEELRILSMVRFMEKLPRLICQFGVPCVPVDSW